MSKIEGLFWLITFVAGCVVLLIIVLANILGDRFFKWWAKTDAEMQGEVEEERGPERKR